MKYSQIHNQSGFSLLELTVAIIILSIILAVAMQSMTTVIDDTRHTKTERELELLSKAIVGDPDITQGGGRADFGYVGDIGSFPPNINSLYSNPGGYATWNGPYLPPGFTQDSTGLKTDEWGTPYNYTGGITITSTGSGSNISKIIARNTNDYLINTVHAAITDGAGNPPGASKVDSIAIRVTFPNGSGTTQTKQYAPDAAGNFTMDSIPVGHHPLRIIYLPAVDTLFRYVAVYPRHKSSYEYKFNNTYFSSGGGGGSCSGTFVLRPNGTGSLTNLNNSGCTNNWQCVDETPSDDDATFVSKTGYSYASDVYAIANPSSNPCAIDSVTVRCRVKETWFLGDIRVAIYVGGTEYNGNVEALTNSYVDYSYNWTNNPSTGTNWTWTEINNLQAGVAVRGGIFSVVQVTQVWVEVAYSN